MRLSFGGRARLMSAIGLKLLNGTTWGVLVLRLGEGGYRWKFVPASGRSFTDAGRAAGHGKPGGDGEPVIRKNYRE